MSVSEDEWAAERASFANGATLGPLARQFADLTKTLLETAPTVGGVLKQVVELGAALVPGADLVSVTLRAPNGEYHTPVETNPAALDLDRLQYEYGEGPCVEAARPDGPGFGGSPELATEPQWPRFGPAAAALGYQSVLATALLPDARPPQQSGALNFYSRRSGVFGPEALETGLLLATHASLALAHTNTVLAAELNSVHLRRAVDSRDVIGQAKGILMQRRGIGADEAFDLLRRASQELNIKLADLARTLATRHTELDLPPEDRQGVS